jgi:hypothetical protein
VETVDWKEVANGLWIWICGGITSGLGLYMAYYFYKRAISFMHNSGVPKEETRSMVRGAVITAIGPVLSNIFIMIALAVAISPGLAFQREGVGVGSVFTELVQASNAAIAAGEKFGDPSFTIKGFAAAVFIMNIAGWGWAVEAIFTRYLGKAREKLTGGDPKLLAVIAACSMVAVFSYYSVSNAIKGNGFLVAVVVSLLSSMFLFKLADWMKRPHFKEWALGIAMFAGMIAGKLYAG